MRQFKIDGNIKTARSEIFMKYTADVNRYALLTHDQEVEIASRARAGDPDAIEKLVNANLRFVISVAKTYSGGRADVLNDLINEGNMGLVEAARAFDPSTGFKFISYAVWHVRKNMFKYLTDNRTIRLPQNRVNHISRIKRITNELTCKLNRDPENWEIFEEYEKQEIQLGRLSSTMNDDQIYGLMRAIEADVRPSNLEGSPTDSPEDQFAPIHVLNGDPLGTDWRVNQESAVKFLMRQISRLKPVEQDIVTSIHGIGRAPETIHSIAHRLGYPVDRVRIKLKKAINKMQITVRKSGIRLEEVI